MDRGGGYRSCKTVPESLSIKLSHARAMSCPWSSLSEERFDFANLYVYCWKERNTNCCRQTICSINSI